MLILKSFSSKKVEFRLVGLLGM